MSAMCGRYTLTANVKEADTLCSTHNIQHTTLKFSEGEVKGRFATKATSQRLAPLMLHSGLD